ncbi:MerR family transcriptional regulator [Oxalobacteraceae bacterium]|nr:MerR family transcriptional regulator [Oxalobacteraceae bacterium]
MMLKVGELAQRTGLTVRTLHHYDSIGLLTPSARSDSGYRLYQRDDIARLHQIQALRRFGMSLADIGTTLAKPDNSIAALVAQQLAALDQQIEQATRLRAQLEQLQRTIASGEEPELASWLTTLELMTMYDKYFSKEELQRLPFYQHNARHSKEWADLVAQVRALMDGAIPADSEQAQTLAHHWMVMLERDTAANPGFVLRINAMLAQEASVQQQTGITPEVSEYVMRAFGAFKLAIYANYLDADELRHMRAHQSTRAHEWPALIAAVREQMDAGTAPTDPLAQQLSRQWFGLFRDLVGDGPDTLQKIRHAHEKEPVLLTGTWMDDTMITFMRDAMASLQQRQT